MVNKVNFNEKLRRLNPGTLMTSLKILLTTWKCWIQACQLDTYAVTVFCFCFDNKTVTDVVVNQKQREYTLLLTIENKMKAVTNQVMLCKIYVTCSVIKHVAIVTWDPKITKQFTNMNAPRSTQQQTIHDFKNKEEMQCSYYHSVAEYC